MIRVRVTNQEDLDVLSLKPSFSIAARISGTVSSRSLLIRMCPLGVVIR